MHLFILGFNFKPAKIRIFNDFHTMDAIYIKMLNENGRRVLPIALCFVILQPQIQLVWHDILSLLLL